MQGAWGQLAPLAPQLRGGYSFFRRAVLAPLAPQILKRGGALAPFRPNDATPLIHLTPPLAEE